MASADDIIATTPVAEVATANAQPHTLAPMSVTYILNDTNEKVSKPRQPHSSIPTPQTSPTPTVVTPNASQDHVDTESASYAPVDNVKGYDNAPVSDSMAEKYPNGVASPAPSTGGTPVRDPAPVGGDGHADTKTEINDIEMTQDDINEPVEAVETVATLAPGHFKCMNDEYDECQTGQTTLDLSRKVISDHFGRNKACTRLITDWPLFCRKHYQRATYNQKLWQSRKIALIQRQFEVIEAQFPGTHYTVAFKKSEEQRLNTFSRKLAAGKTELEAAAMVAPAERGKHFEAPVNVLREIEQLNYLGQDKTKADAEAAVNTISDMLESEDTTQVPSIEFLPQLDAAGHPYVAANRGRPSKKTSKKVSTARVSKKGAVSKPSSAQKKSAKKGNSKA